MLTTILNKMYEFEVAYMNWWFSKPNLINALNAASIIMLVVAAAVVVKNWIEYRKVCKELKEKYPEL